MSGMINHLYVIESNTYIPYKNQALEEYLLDYVDKDSLILYLWQNQNTIVIGKNQNPFNECKVDQLESDNGYLARRLSGGGAVYHDLGNINFTFLSTKDNYDVEKQTDVILKAMKSLGLNAYKNGRNDLLIDDKKFSGHAYYTKGRKCYHHGTIMYDVDQGSLWKYLTVNILKIKDKAINSVKSRVINLRQLNNDITVDDIKESLKNSFKETYGLDIEYLSIDDLDQSEMERLTDFYASDDWRYGKIKEYKYSIEDKFDFGLVKIEYDLDDNIISDITIYTDSLYTDSIEKLIDILKGKNIYNLDNIELDDIQKEIVEFIRRKQNV